MRDRSAHSAVSGPAEVSVVIPTLDRVESLRRALASVFAQTLPPQEVIVVDDGSTDGTAELVRRAFSQVRYLRQDNQGVSAARNRGIQEAGCAWIALLDSDDEWLPGKLEAQFQVLAGQPGALVCHTEEIWVRRGVRVNPMKKHAKTGGWIFRQCLPRCVMSPSSILIQRSVFDRVGLFDEALPACEDYDLWLRITARYPVAFVAEPQIIKYGGHEDQLSRRHWGMDRFRIRALEKIIASGMLSEGDRRAAAGMLAEKAGIIAAGAEKRGKWDEAARYAAMRDHHASAL